MDRLLQRRTVQRTAERRSPEMTVIYLALLALVTPLAPPATAAPEPAVNSAPSFGAQFNQFDPYTSQLYRQQAYDYNTAQINSGLHSGYYGYGTNYYSPATYDRNRFGDQSASFGVGSHQPLKIDSSDDGKYHPKKYNTGQYDANRYNAGKSDARNYDSGHYDHAKYGTKPLPGARLGQTSGPGNLRVNSVGSESRLTSGTPGFVGFTASGSTQHSGKQIGRSGQQNTGIAAQKSSFVHRNPIFHAKQSSTLKKEPAHKLVKSAGKKFSFNKKDVFSKIDVFGPNHRQIFTGGKRVFSGDQTPALSPAEQSGFRQVDPAEESGSGVDSYGFYSDLTNLYSDKPFDAKPSSVNEAFNQRPLSNDLSFNAKQSSVASLEPAFSSGLGQLSGGTNSFSRQPAAHAGADGDSYGYYSDLSNLYGDKPWQQGNGKAVLGAKTAAEDFDNGLSENKLSFDNERTKGVGQLRQKVSPKDIGFDSYGFYSNLENLYRPENLQGSTIAKAAAKKPTKFTSALDKKSPFKDPNAGAPANGITFDNQQNNFRQKTPSNDATFDSYGFYSDLNNLYRADASAGILKTSVTSRPRVNARPVGPRPGILQASPVSQLNERTPGDSSLANSALQQLDANQSQNNVDFDSYGFYSDLGNLYA